MVSLALSLILLAAMLPATSSDALAGRDGENPLEPGPIRRTAGSPPWPRDFELGLQIARAYAHHFGLAEEDSLLHHINRLGYEVASQAGRNDILFTFHIIDIPDPNAFALPGGFIFLTRGMVDMQLPDEALANLLGHEIVHVADNHFARNNRLSGLMSILHTVAVVAAVIAVPSTPGGGWDVDHDTGMMRGSLVGKDAAIQGTMMFGGVLRELLMRGYSRTLEFEADDRGRRYAARAGYPVSGSVTLLEELHRRVHEDHDYGYWHTHPYFDDRIARARAARDAGSSPPDSGEVARYRADVQRRLFAIGSSILDESTALFVLRAALKAGPGGEAGLDVEHRLLNIRADRQRRLAPLLRSYGPIIADYDTLITRIGDDDAVSPLRAELLHERRVLDRERADLHPRMLEALSSPNPRTLLLELFLENFPDDPVAPDVRSRLADQYRLSNRPDEAAMLLDEAIRRSLESGNGAGDLDTSLDQMRLVMGQVRSPLTTQRILTGTRSDSVRTWAESRLHAQAAGLDSLELASRFAQEYPESPVSAEVNIRLEEMAMARHREGRLKESLGDYQAALNLYNELILLAPRTRGAELSRQGVARIQGFVRR